MTNYTRLDKTMQSLIILTEERKDDWTTSTVCDPVRQSWRKHTQTHIHLSPHNTHRVLYALPAFREREKTQQSYASHLISPTSALSHPESCFQLHLRREIRKNAERFSHPHTVPAHSADRTRWWGKTYLFDVVARLGTGLDKHHTQLFGPLLAFFNRDLPVKRLNILIHLFKLNKFIYKILLHCDDHFWKKHEFPCWFSAGLDAGPA